MLTTTEYEFYCQNRSANYTAMGNAGSIPVATGIFLFNIWGSHGSEDVDLDF
jgi:hypothetical protein